MTHRLNGRPSERPAGARVRAFPRAVTALTTLLLLASLFFSGGAAQARPLLNSFSVNTSADELDAGACGSISGGSGPDGQLSLREAICEANNNGAGPHTILLPAGTYSLSPTLGALLTAPNGNQAITISGAGAGSTTIQATNTGCPSLATCNNRVFDLDHNLAGGAVVTLQGMTIAHGRTSDNIGGAGIIAGCEAPGCPNGADATTISGVTFTDNNVLGTALGAAGGAIQNVGGTLVVVNSTFNANSAGAFRGGGIFYDSHSPSASTLTVAGSAFTGNSANSDNSGGGAIYASAVAGSNLTISGSTFAQNTAGGSSAGGGAIYKDGEAALTVDHSNFSANQVTSSSAIPNLSSGGAIDVNGGTLSLSFSRVTGNTTALPGNGGGLYTAGGASATAQNDWWGCNGGPGASGCDSASGNGANTLAPWIVLSLSASPNPVYIYLPTTLTASFLQNSAAAALTPGQVSALIGLPVTWGGAVNGALSNQQAAIQNDGTAAAVFTGSSLGSGSASATVDHGTVNAAITIQAFPDQLYLPIISR